MFCTFCWSAPVGWDCSWESFILAVSTSGSLPSSASLKTLNSRLLSNFHSPLPSDPLFLGAHHLPTAVKIMPPLYRPVGNAVLALSHKGRLTPTWHGFQNDVIVTWWSKWYDFLQIRNEADSVPCYCKWSVCFSRLHDNSTAYLTIS